MSITVRDDPAAGRYEVYQDDERAGVAAYTLDGGRITFTHTRVEPAYEGKGLARRLVTEALDDAARRGLAVVPLCPYVRSIISRGGDRYVSLVPADVRDRLGIG
jgi:predicted GNAT family acetyltransferase